MLLCVIVAGCGDEQTAPDRTSMKRVVGPDLAAASSRSAVEAFIRDARAARREWKCNFGCFYFDRFLTLREPKRIIRKRFGQPTLAASWYQSYCDDQAQNCDRWVAREEGWEYGPLVSVELAGPLRDTLTGRMDFDQGRYVEVSVAPVVLTKTRGEVRLDRGAPDRTFTRSGGGVALTCWEYVVAEAEFKSDEQVDTLCFIDRPRR
jgi:hypothetical protein